MCHCCSRLSILCVQWSGPAAAAVAQQIKKDSRGTIGIGVTHAEAVRWLSVFRNLPELRISCYTSSRWWMRREGLAGIVAWLLRAVRAADGLAQLVVQAIVQCGIKPSLLSLLVANQVVDPVAHAQSWPIDSIATCSGYFAKGSSGSD